MYKMTRYIIYTILEQDVNLVFGKVATKNIVANKDTQDYKRGIVKKKGKGQPFIPILVDEDFNLLDGNRRYTNAVKLGEEIISFMRIIKNDGTYMNGDQLQKWLDEMDKKYKR